LTSIIDAVEGRDKAITDIKGAYLNAKMVDEVLMKITGAEVDMFCEIDPSLEDFVTLENRRGLSMCSSLGTGHRRLDQAEASTTILARNF
jgi:hypothetical protein